MNYKDILIVVIAAILIGGSWFFVNSNKQQSPPAVDQSLPEQKYEIVALDTQYAEGITGYYSSPAEEGDYPGVVMVHEWWGLNDNIKQMARDLSGQGYRVLAVDLFGSVAQTPDEARAQVGALDQEKARGNLQSAAEFLRTQGSTRLASLGWCFGGGQSLQLALSGEILNATVIYYGSLVTDEQELSAITWPVLGIFGEEDQSITPERVREFEYALENLAIEHEIHLYPGVGHAFANPSGDNYAQTETIDAWLKTLAFLEQNLR